jgi:hypothetical protein
MPNYVRMFITNDTINRQIRKYNSFETVDSVATADEVASSQQQQQRKSMPPSSIGGNSSAMYNLRHDID